MNCRQVNEYLDRLLVAESEVNLLPELLEHIESCPSCASEYRIAQETLASLQISQTVEVSSNLKESIMNEVYKAHANPLNVSDTQYKPIRVKLWKPVFAAAAILILLAVVSIFLKPGPRKNDSAPASAFSLLSQALANEEALGKGGKVVHIVNEIVVQPISNVTLAQARWFPMMALEANGKPRFHQLSLPGEVGESYVVQDDIWYDPAAGRFSRILSTEDKPLFANAYDGELVYSLEYDDNGNPVVYETPVTEDFQPPQHPAQFLGIMPGISLPANSDNNKEIVDVGETVLDDGAKARILKSGFVGKAFEGPNAAQFLTTIREDDNTIVQMDFQIAGQSLYVLRRVLAETLEHADVAWNLPGIERRVEKSQQTSGAKVVTDMVIPNVSVQHMVERADYETFIFAMDPPWAGERQITDVLFPNSSQRMFIITYRAEDKRHVVLWQSPISNEMFGPKIEKAELKYTSPNGFKVWSLSEAENKRGSMILLTSARATILDLPAEDRTGYILESPAGTFPALAINGPVSDEELHALIDSLMSAKEYMSKAAISPFLEDVEKKQ